MKHYMLITFSIAIPLFSLAQIATSSTDNSINPTLSSNTISVPAKARFCDQAKNENIIKEIKSLQNKMDQEKDPQKKEEILSEIVKTSQKAQCEYRSTSVTVNLDDLKYSAKNKKPSKN